MKNKQFSTRKLFNKLFHGAGLGSALLLGISLIILLFPIFYKGIQAVCFYGTVEHQRMMIEQFGEKPTKDYEQRIEKTNLARENVKEMIVAHEQWIKKQPLRERRSLNADLQEIKLLLSELLGPIFEDKKPILLREQYGSCRWDYAKNKLKNIIYLEEWVDVVNDQGEAIDRQLKKTLRQNQFINKPLYDLFPYLETHLKELMAPEFIFYWKFFTNTSKDAHIFGGIWAEILGTLYLTIGAMLIAIPIGIVSAVYFVEYARENFLISFLQSCISTLAGVPSVVFGLFGLAFFINTLHISNSKSTIVGSLTLALLILPTIIRSSEEAIKSIPKTYKEASLALGATRWKTIYSVLLPAALPGILTGIIISMGRAAGETAPIMFTAAVSVGKPLKLWQIFSEPTPALPWNIYNLATEHEAMDLISHVQFGMVATLILIVFFLNLTAIIIRAKMMNKQR